MADKIVADYARISIVAVEELDCIEYWLYLHDSIIWNYRQTEKGQEKLKQAWRLSQTKADKEKLREKGLKKIW